MKTPVTDGVLAVLILTLPTVGGWSLSRPRSDQAQATRQFSENSDLAAQRARAVALFRDGKYTDAVREFRLGYRQASLQGHSASAVRFLNGIGAAYLADLRYRAAIREFTTARQLARSLKDWEIAGIVSVNIASLCFQMGDFSSAAENSAQALAALSRVPHSRHRGQALAQRAMLSAWAGDFASALPDFTEALREADRQGDIAFQSLVLNQLGYEYLNRGRLDEADRVLTEGFRLRVLAKSREIGPSYRALGLLRLAQGDFASSDALLRQAVLSAERNPGRVPSWSVYHARGELRIRQHRLPEAVRDFAKALELARTWRLEVLPSDSMRSSADVEAGQIYSSFIRASSDLYFRTGREDAARDAFAAAEEIRAAALRAALDPAARWRDRLPPEYDETLRELRTARTDLLRADSPDVRSRVQLLRTRLGEMEVAAGLDEPPDPAGLQASAAALAAALGPREAFVSFHLDEPNSYTWTVTREGLRLHRFSGAAETRKTVKAFIEALRQNSPAAVGLGELLYAELFGGAAARLGPKTHWLLAVEDALFGLPFPALVLDRIHGQPVFLAERHAVTLVPGARLFLDSAARRAANNGSGSRGFLGIADPVYNRADERWSGSAQASGTLELPRLAGSAQEVRTCARAWGQQASPLLLEGPSATRRRLETALAGAPGIIHFATHVLGSGENPARRLIPLSLSAAGDPDYLGPEEIASWRLPWPALVVISGCASGIPEPVRPEFHAPVLPSSAPSPALGLVGLARAWLAAGARNVAVSLWTTPDDGGDLFRSFYRHLAHDDAAEPALALEHAQIEMLKSDTWRSAPRHWAAYVIIGKG